MKVIFILWFCLSCSWSLADSLSDEPFMLLGNCLDVICIGDDENKAIQALDSKELTFSKIDLQLEGDYSPTIRVLYGSSHFDVELSESKVWRITNYAKEIKNKDGFGPGIPIKKLFERYTFKNFDSGEGRWSFKFHEIDGHVFNFFEHKILKQEYWRSGCFGSVAISRHVHMRVTPLQVSVQDLKQCLNLNASVHATIQSKQGD